MHDRKNRVRLITLVTIYAALLSGCGGDDSPTAAAAPAQQPATSATPTSNSPPQLAGTPTATVLHGTDYSFAPHASDGDDHSLTFAVENLPPWATFDASTGSLTGTPTPSDVGTYENIRIKVSDGETTTSLAPFRIEVTAVATGAVTLNWDPPTETIDGSSLNDLGGYRVYWGTAEGVYTNSTSIDHPGITSYVIEQLTPAQWFFVMTAFTTAGVESGFSDVASRIVR